MGILCLCFLLVRFLDSHSGRSVVDGRNWGWVLEVVADVAGGVWVRLGLGVDVDGVIVTGERRGRSCPVLISKYRL